MWDYIKSAFSIFRNTATPTNQQGIKMANLTGYIIVALGVFIVILITTIFILDNKNADLQEQVNRGHIALEFQNNIIESNRAKNEKLNKDLQNYLEKVKRDFSNIAIPQAQHKEATNQCEAFIKELAKAYQQ